MKTKPRSNIQILWRLLKSSRGFFALCILSGLCMTGCELLLPQIIRVTVDSVIGANPPELPGLVLGWFEAAGGRDFFRGHMWMAAVLIAAVSLASALFRYVTNLFNAKAGETLVKTIRDTLYGHIQHLPWRWHQANPTGDIIQRCTSDVERVKTFFQEQFVIMFRIVILILLSLSCMIGLNFRLSLVAIIAFPIIVTYSFLFHNKIRERFTQCDINEGILSTIAQENLTGVRVVRAFGREAYERERFEKQNQVYTEYWMKLCRTLADFWAVGDMTSGLQIMLVVVLGSVLCVKGQLSSGEFIAFLAYNAMLVSPVRRLGRIVSEMSKAGVSIDRIAEILNAPVEADAPGAEEAPMTGDIVYENVSFAYTEGQPVLDNVSFTIPAGTSFGILGGTGSGKSSLLLLLSRLYEPAEGRITVGGKDIAQMPAHWVRQNVGIVLQEPFLFSRTLEENIGICGAEEEAVRAAAATACIAEDIHKFTHGYETLVGERGVTLSGGQKQRVAMARMLTKKTPILVFDDSLSAVDTETDEKIRAALNRDLHRSTTVIISHRITTLMDCDTILVLEKGRVTELGSHEQLLENNGLYRRIYDMQMSLGEEESE